VSKIILGGGSFGDVRYQPWVLDLEEALPLLEYAWKKGINTWDTVSSQMSISGFIFCSPILFQEDVLDRG
jgi:hypothetical protein